MNNISITKIFSYPRIFLRLIKAKIHFQLFSPIFIIGSPRSGTTLLFQMLSTAPNFSNKFEPEWVWKKALGTSGNDSYKDEFTFIGMMRVLNNFYSLIDKGAPFLLVKNPKDSLRVKFLRNLFPNARFIHIIRDGRDVIASIKKGWDTPYYRTDKDYDWIHLRIPDYKILSSLPAHIKGAHIWTTCLQFIENTIDPKDYKHFYEIKYEDLVKDPQTEMNKLSTYLEVSLQQNDLEKLIEKVSVNVKEIKIGTNKQEDQNLNFQHIPSKVSNDAGSGTLSSSIRIGKWINTLSTEELFEILPIIEKFLVKYNYL